VGSTKAHKEARSTIHKRIRQVWVTFGLLGDDKATITREEQQRRLVELILSELNHVAQQTRM
jgi:hypothetical protein